jgi:hypothetical protein
MDKRAFFECLQQLGHQPSSAAEAGPLLKKPAAAASPSPYAYYDEALDHFLGIKPASAPVNRDGLDDVSVSSAMELAKQPMIFASALVVKAAIDAQSHAAAR